MGLSALFVYGMWYGIVNRRWGTLGLIAFLAVQALVALAVTFAYSWADAGGSPWRSWTSAWGPRFPLAPSANWPP